MKSLLKEYLDCAPGNRLVFANLRLGQVNILAEAIEITLCNDGRGRLQRTESMPLFRSVGLSYERISLKSVPIVSGVGAVVLRRPKNDLRGFSMNVNPDMGIYLNRAEICPFCGDGSLSFPKEAALLNIRDAFSALAWGDTDRALDHLRAILGSGNFFRRGYTFKRCVYHKQSGIGYKGFLEKYEPSVFDKTYGCKSHKSKRQDQKKGVLRRIRKVRKIRQLNESEREFFGMILGLKKLNQVTR